MAYDQNRAQIGILLGAGFSRWSCGLPLVSELFDFNLRLDNEIEARRVHLVRDDYNRWAATHPDRNNEAFIAFIQASPQKSRRVNWYIARRLAEPFIVGSGRRYTWYINSYHAKTHAGISLARGVIEKLMMHGDPGILTTNYDLIVEYALGTSGFHYGVRGEQIGWSPYPYPTPVYAKGRIPLAKLHGSLSWSISEKRPDTRFGLTGKCLIVPPLVDKSPRNLLVDQWELAKNILLRSDILVIFGFAFNDYDTEIGRFASAYSKRIPNVIHVDIVDQTNKLRGLFPAQDIKFVNARASDLLVEIEKAISTLQQPLENPMRPMQRRESNKLKESS